MNINDYQHGFAKSVTHISTPKSDNSMNFWWFTLAAIITVTIIEAIFLYATSFLIRYNDHWGILAHARSMELTRPSSWHNGFLPSGWPLILKLVSKFDIVYSPIILNFVFSWICMLSVAKIVRVLTTSAWSGAIAILLLHSSSRYFLNVTQPTPDVGCAAWVALAALFFLYSCNEECPQAACRRALLAGAFLGAATLWRYHVLALACGFIFSFFLASKRPFKVLLASLAGFSLVYSVQILVSLSSGNGVLGISSGYFAYLTLYGYDMSRAGAPEEFRGSLLDLFRMSRAHFIETWIRKFAGYLPALGLTAIASYLPLGFKWSRFASAIFIAITIYFSATSLGSSGRDWIPVMPLLIIAFTVLINYCVRINNISVIVSIVSRMIFVGLIMLWILFNSLNIWKQVGLSRYISSAYDDVERFLVDELRVTDGSEIFSNDVDIYFPNFQLPVPLRYGGWERHGSNSYHGELPPLELSWSSYISQMRKSGVKVIILNRRYYFNSDDLLNLHNGKLETNDVKLVYKKGWFSIFLILSDVKSERA